MTSQERSYKKYTDQDKQNLFHLVRDKGLSTRAAALQLDVNPSTAQNWVKKEQVNQPYKSEEPVTTFTGFTSSNRFSETPETGTYKKYTPQDKENLFYLTRERGMNTRSAALQLGINPSTAQTWVKKEQDDQDARIYRQTQERAASVSSASSSSSYSSFGSPQKTVEPYPVQHSPMNTTQTYKKYTPQDKENLFHLIREGMNTRSAALQLGINPSTAQTWVKKEQDDQDARIYRQTQERAASVSSASSPSSYSSFGSPQKTVEPYPVQHSPMNTTQTYKKYTAQDKENLFRLIGEGKSTRSAALQLGINPSTAQTWVKKEQDDTDARLYKHTEKHAAVPSKNATGYASESEEELESPITPQKSTEQPMNATRTYNHYTPQDKENLFHLIREKGMNTSAAASQLGINPSTAQSWVKKEKDYAKETGQTSKLLEKQETPVLLNISDAGKDTHVVTPQAVSNSEEPVKQTRTYKKYTPQDKENLFHLVKDKGMSTRGAAIQLGINPSTAQNWVQKDRENPQPVQPQLADQRVPEKENYEQSVPEKESDEQTTPEQAEPVKAKRTYKKYTPQDKEKLFELVKEKGMSTRGAAMLLGINPSTAQSWVRKDREENAEIVKGDEATLSKEQEEFLTTKISEQGVLTLDEMFDSLKIEFKGIDVSKTALCHFAMKKYAICFTLKT